MEILWKKFEKIYPLYVEQFEEFSPVDNESITDKMNKVIQSLNRIGRLSESVVRDWNKVFEWVMNESLEAEILEQMEQWKNDGTFETLLTSMIDEVNARVDGFQSTLDSHTTQLSSVVKTVNGLTPDVSGNVVVSVSGGDATTLKGKTVPTPTSSEDEKVLAWDNDTNSFKYVSQGSGSSGDATTLKGKTVPAPTSSEDEKVLAWDEDINSFKYVPLPAGISAKSLTDVVINVLDYGTNTASFASAISYLSSLGGGVLLIPAGTYNISSLAVDGVHNLTILNYGTIKATGTVSKFIEIKNCNDFKMINGTIDGNNFATYGISLLNSPRFTLENVYVKNVGSDALGSSAYGIGIGYSCNYGLIRNTRVNYVHSSTVASGIGFGLQSGAITDYELMPKHCTVDNANIEDISPQLDADGLKILSDGIIDCDLVVKNSRFLNCRKRGIKFQAGGCRSENNYIEFTSPFASAGIDFQRGYGSSNNDTIVFSGNPSSVLDGGGNVIDGNGIIYAPILISVGDVRISGLKYRVKNDYSMLVQKLGSSSLVRFTWLAESGIAANTPVKNVIIENVSAQAIPRLITFQIPVDNLTFKNNTVELMYNTMITGAYTVTNFKFKDNKFTFLDTTALTFNSSSTIISSGDFDVQDSTAKIFFNIRGNDVRAKINRMGDNLNSRNFEQRQGIRTHFMNNIPSSFTSDSGLQFNSCAIGDICLNTNKQPLSDGVGNYVIDKWECTAIADGTFTRGQWRAYKQYY